MDKMVMRVGQPKGEAPESSLSDREMQVLLRLARGATTREVSEFLHLSVSTIETYRSRILEKLNLRNNSDLTRFAIRRGLIDLD
jgi:DNA-binding NarL/FixJ family response regulator